GEYPPGEKLPTYDELAEQYRCSIAAARRAVELLRQQGLVITAQGKGSFVRERPGTRRHGIERYSRSRWLTGGQAILVAEAAAQGWTGGQRLRFLGEVPAPGEVADRLGIAEGTPVWVRQRTTLINGRPNQLADSYYELPVTRAAPRLRDEDTGPGGGFARLEEAGYRLERIREELTARMPVGPETVALDLPEGTPVIDLIRTTYDDAGQVVEVMVSVIAGDMATFCYDFPIPD
ncbi:MAG TPA: GntR family transcriptional regulator, partial [Streptosporangiaceae bacterium]